MLELISMIQAKIEEVLEKIRKLTEAIENLAKQITDKSEAYDSIVTEKGNASTELDQASSDARNRSAQFSNSRSLIGAAKEIISAVQTEQGVIEADINEYLKTCREEIDGDCADKDTKEKRLVSLSTELTNLRLDLQNSSEE